MNILLISSGFIIAFIIVFCYERKIINLSAKTRNLSAKPINKVHFYVARDKNDGLFLYIGKPIRFNTYFISINSVFMFPYHTFHYFGLNENDFDNLKWEDEPLEVFLNMEE